MSTNFQRAIRARETGEVLLELVTLSHAGFRSTIRRVDNTEDIVSRGETWLARPMQVVLPRETASGSTTGRIVFDDTDLEVSEALRAVATPPDVVIEIVRASDTEAVERSYRHLEVSTVTIDDVVATVGLGLADYRREFFPAGTMSPPEFPALF